MVKEFFFGTDFTDFHCFIYSAEWSPQASGLASKVEGAAPGSGAQSTVACDFTLGPDPSVQGLD